MLKGGLGLLVLAVVALLAAPTLQRGCQDLTRSAIHLRYYPVRDMRRSVSIAPQTVVLPAPDTASVPVTGKELEVDRDRMAATLVNPVPPSDSALARGERVYRKLCVPCHGKDMAGDGPVAAQFMPPPDLLGAPTRARRDGYLYSYLRHGGVVMPNYGAQLSAEDAWNLIHFLRQRQKVSSR